VKDMIAYLRLVHNPSDSVSFNRIINVPTRGIGAKTLQQVQDWAAANGWQPGDAVLEIATNADAQHPFRARALSALQDFGNMLFAWITVRDSATVGELFDLILEQTQYREYIDDGTEEGRDRWENVMELRSVAADATLTLSEFLEQVALVSEADNVEEAPSSTTLLTLHAAKGLEFPVVFITGLEEGMLPHSRSMDDAEELAEERRLFYVGITRAKDRLYLSHAFRRSFYGEPEASTPSRFLLDIPDELTSGGRPQARRQQSISRASSWNQKTPSWSWSSGSSGGGQRPSPSRPSSAPSTRNPTPERRTLPTPNYLKADPEPDRSAPASASYSTGQRVRHAKFGEGIVIESKVMGNDEEVSVAFKEAGIKRLAASFAKLEVLD
ncbi:MAG: ATP-binding domain-containing protein, partial [Ardenticatenaceae bacterium]|nr:ATP-binding domain-containing protein [Ardenticatenaceae bacterium]